MLTNTTPNAIEESHAVGAKAVQIYLRQFNNDTTRANIISSLRRIFDIFAELAGEDSSQYGDDRYIHFAWQKLSYDSVLALRTKLEVLCGVNKQRGDLSPQTANKYLSVIKSMSKALMLADLISVDVYTKITKVRNLDTVRVLRGRALSPDEIKLIVETMLVSGDPSNIRNAAMILVGIQCALRDQELALIQMVDFSNETGRVSVIGKGRGGKEIIVFMSGEALRVVNLWLTIRGDADGFLFCTTKNGSPIHSSALKSGSFWIAIQRFCKKHNIPEFSVHDLKRTGINQVYDVSDDLGQAQFTGHHSNSQTTSKNYIRVNEKRIRDRHTKLNGLTGVYD